MKVKSLIIAFCLVLAFCGVVSAQEGLKTTVEKGISSKIIHVTVYPQWAYVTRLAEVSLSGKAEKFFFKNLPAWIDEESIRVRVESPGECTIIGASTKTIYLVRATEEEVHRAEEEVTKLRDKIEDINAEINILSQEKAYLSDLKVWKLEKVPHESAVREVTTDELHKVKNFITDELLKNVSKTTELKRKIRDLQPELRAKEKEWADVKSRARLEKKEIIVELSSKRPARAELFVSYLISGASWYPSYDARTDVGREKINLSCEAILQQTTGEDWKDATFTLSTIQPYLMRQKPELAPWYINTASVQTISRTPQQFSTFRGSGKEKRRMQKIQQKQEGWNVANAPGAWKGFSRNSQQAMEVIRQVEERGTTAEFDIIGRYSVKTDGKAVKMPIGITELNAIRRYSAAPAVSKSTYVTAKMRNKGKFPFLPGPVKVYVAGSLIGKSKIDCVAEEEKFELYLGLEERIKVTRELDTKKSSIAIFSRKKRLNVAYNIKVKNFLKGPATIEISDQIPVSQDATVKVKLLNTDPNPGKTEKGIITWPLRFDAGEAKTIHFEFQVEYPETVQLRRARQLEEQILRK